MVTNFEDWLKDKAGKSGVVASPARITPDGRIELVQAMHPVCPGCGQLIEDWDLVGPDFAIKVDVIDGEPALCVLTELECTECGHVSHWGQSMFGEDQDNG